MKKITIIILLILFIVLGVTWLVSENSKKEEIITNNEELPTTENALNEGRHCYAYSHEATPGEPYDVAELLDITVVGEIITGEKSGTQNGPDMNNGYEGDVTGTLDGNTMILIYSYEVEGSQNKEKEIYRRAGEDFEKLRYPLIPENDILVPDTTKEFKTLIYTHTKCSL